MLAWQTDLHEDWTLQGAARTLSTPILWWPVTSQEQKIYIWQAIMLSHIQELQLDVAISTLRVVPVNHFTSYVHLPRYNLNSETCRWGIHEVICCTVSSESMQHVT